MATGIMWIFIGVLNILTSLLNKSTYESKGKSSFGWGILCGLNIVLILLWICKLTGIIVI